LRVSWSLLRSSPRVSAPTTGASLDPTPSRGAALTLLPGTRLGPYGADSAQRPGEQACEFCTVACPIELAVKGDDFACDRLTVEETAEALGVSAPTVMRDWRLARAWLTGELGGRV
jgi:anaerobic selenocysteine-containing dehydrogenase